MKLLLAVALLTATPAALAQVPRDAVVAGLGTSTEAVASSGDHTVALWTNGVDEEILRYATSDGRGLDWSFTKFLAFDYGTFDNLELAMVGDGRTYVLFTEGESSTALDRVYSRRSLDGGITWEAKKSLFVNSFWSNGDRIQDMVVQEGATDDRIFALVRDTPFELKLYSSFDSGQTWTSGLELTDDFEDHGRLVVDGDSVHVVYLSSPPFDENLCYRRSTDAGATFEPEIVLQTLPDDTSWGHPDVDAEGSRVVIGTWWCCDFVRSYASDDGGASFPTVVDHANDGVTSAAQDVLVRGGEVWLSWFGSVPGGAVDDRAVHVIHSADGGSTWGSPEIVSDTTLSVPEVWLDEVLGRVVATTFTGSDTQSALWNDATDSFAPHFAAVGQATLQSVVDVNETYGNVLVLFDGADGQCWAGGYRPQGIAVNGLQAGLTDLSFDFDLFDSQSAAAWTLFALAPGDWHLPDGRNLGIALDPLAIGAIDLALLGLTAAPLDPTGAGSSPVLPIGLPPGLSFTVIGVGIDLGSGTVGAITDAITIST